MNTTKHAILSALALLSAIASSPALTTAQIRSPAVPNSGAANVELHYSDGTPTSFGIEAVNARLAKIGVRVSQVEIPERAKPILRLSKSRALTDAEANALIRIFRLNRGALLNEISSAGRRPAMRRGGYLQTSETNVAPYPKVYDMKALDDELTAFLQDKFGRLHVNSSEDGVGIDEVMTIVSGGPYTWFFVLDSNVVAKLRFSEVAEDGKAWRISYPGIVPHGGYFDAADGLVVAYAHGPKHFVMRYEEASVDGYETLGDNPWIDFSKEKPALLDQPKELPMNKAESRESFADVLQ